MLGEAVLGHERDLDPMMESVLGQHQQWLEPLEHDRAAHGVVEQIGRQIAQRHGVRHPLGAEQARERAGRALDGVERPLEPAEVALARRGWARQLPAPHQLVVEVAPAEPEAPAERQRVGGLLDRSARRLGVGHRTCPPAST